MTDLTTYVFTAPQEVEVETKGTTRYVIDGKPLVHREFVLDGKTPVSTEPYIVLRYRALDLQRFFMLRQSLFSGVAGDTETPLLCVNEMFTDGREHLVIARCGKADYDFLRLRLRSRAPHVEFTVLEFYTCTYDELPKRFDEEEVHIDGYKCIDLTKFGNGTLSDEPGAIDGGIGYPEGTVGLSGIPFAFSAAVRPDAPPKENDEIVRNFNTEARRRLCRPESRDSHIVIPVGARAKELYFVLAMDGLMLERWGFCAPDPTILGSSQGEVMMPLKVNDVERFAVIVTYADGTVDECFPERVTDHRHEVSGEVGVYGVTTKDCEITSVAFADRMLDTDVLLCALTLNTDAERRLSDASCARRHHAEKRFSLERRAYIEGDTLHLENGAFSMTLDTKDGLFVRELSSAFSADFRMAGALLKVIDGDKTVEHFERIGLDERRISYRYGDIVITVFFDTDTENGIRMNMKAENRGEEKAIGIRFPALSDVCYRTPEDTWYFLPKYQNTESNASCYVYEESAPSFPMQFFDIFSPAEGAGLALTTRERDLKVRKYGMMKQLGRTDAFVEYPEMYGRIAHDGVFRGSEALLFVHEGDWHAAYHSYKDWLSTWYEPYKCQNKKWYREKFWLVAEIRDFIETRDIMKFPVWYEKETGTYNFRMIMEEMTKLYGETPDILHMWAWTWNNDKGHMQWGNFGGSDYDKLGGLENFRNALRDVSDATGAEISLYMHPTLLSDVYPQAETFFPTLRVKNAAGRYIDCLKDSFRMCHANKTWRDFALSMYPRVHEETGVRLLYVDEFSLRVDNRCYADGHGHEVPSNLLKTDRQFISELKDIMPEDVVLYGEYYAVDINARYIDCNISYYILDAINAMIEQGVHSEDGSDELGGVLTDIYRFAFPKIVQLILPMAMRNKTWQPLKATFFNGEAIYDSFWDAEESRGRRFMAKAFRIKKDYADCFSSDEPETMIDACLDAICANRFCGDGRNVYTLYNRSTHTVEGEVLELPYREGTTYVDIWNGCPAEFTVKDGTAYVKTRVTAQNVGAIAEIFA